MSSKHEHWRRERPLSHLFVCSAAHVCSSRAARNSVNRPDSENKGCRERAGQPAVSQNEEAPLPGGPQWPCSGNTGGGGGERNAVHFITEPEKRRLSFK